MCACHGRTLFRLVFVIYGSPQLSHQNQMLTANYKSLTANYKVAHSKFKGVPFCRGSRVFFRVSRVHCRGEDPYFTKGKPNYQIILMYIMHIM